MLYMAASALLYATASFFVAKSKAEANSFQAVFVSMAYWQLQYQNIFFILNSWQ